MTIGFSTKFPEFLKGIAGKETMFIEKILHGYLKNNLITLEQWSMYMDILASRQKIDLEYLNLLKQIDHPGKIHTFRNDEKDRWGKDVKIHPVIDNRSPNRLQFAPESICTGFERIRIEHQKSNVTRVYIENVLFWEGLTFAKNQDERSKKIVELSTNDGFDSVNDFFHWFNTDFEGKIIHWTPFRYIIKQ